MMNVQNKYVDSTIVPKISAGKTNPRTSQDKSNDVESVIIDRDTFEHIVSEDLFTYSPKTIRKSEDVSSVTASTNPSYATTDSQRKNLHLFLAAKMAGLRTYSDGSPIVTNKDDAAAIKKAQETIHGDHKRLSYNSAYRYSQLGNNYGYDNALTSCCTYAFATALSIKNGKKITPDQITTDSSTNGHNPVISEWGAYSVKTSGSDTLKGIDAQLQLGNPVVIHAYGTDSSGTNSQHWATVIGKENGKYIIIDPWDGQEHTLDEMQVYKNNGTIADYIILTNEY